MGCAASSRKRLRMDEAEGARGKTHRVGQHPGWNTIIVKMRRVHPDERETRGSTIRPRASRLSRSCRAARGACRAATRRFRGWRAARFSFIWGEKSLQGVATCRATAPVRSHTRAQRWRPLSPPSPSPGLSPSLAPTAAPRDAPSWSSRVRRGRGPRSSTRSTSRKTRRWRPWTTSGLASTVRARRTLSSRANLLLCPNIASGARASPPPLARLHDARALVAVPS